MISKKTYNRTANYRAIATAQRIFGIMPWRVQNVLGKFKNPSQTVTQKKVQI